MSTEIQNQGPTGLPRVGGSDAAMMMSYEANKKSVGVAYLLWFFLGGFGVHRFYLGKTGSGIGMLALTIIGIVLSLVYVGVFLLFAVGVWMVVDAFLIPGIARAYNNGLASALSGQALVR